MSGTRRNRGRGKPTEPQQLQVCMICLQSPADKTARQSKEHCPSERCHSCHTLALTALADQGSSNQVLYKAWREESFQLLGMPDKDVSSTQDDQLVLSSKSRQANPTMTKPGGACCAAVLLCCCAALQSIHGTTEFRLGRRFCTAEALVRPSIPSFPLPRRHG